MSTEIVPDAIPVEADLLPAEAPGSTLFRTEDPIEVLAQATRLADALKRVIADQKLFKRIGAKDHVFVEAWTTLGSMLGVVPVVVWTRKLENGWEARCEARTLDGRVVGAAEAQCLETEAKWKGGDDYRRRSMAQTRAISRALRGPLGFVVTLAGFDATPAEEMPDTGPTAAPAAPATPLDDPTVAELASVAKDLIRRKIWDARTLTMTFVAAGAKDTSGIEEALRTLTTTEADDLRSTMADLLAAAEAKR